MSIVKLLFLNLFLLFSLKNSLIITITAATARKRRTSSEMLRYFAAHNFQKNDCLLRSCKFFPPLAEMGR